METQPTQYEIDQIASFVEAAEELKREPFFHADENRTIRTGGFSEQTYIVGDRCHFRSALVSFRRVWMNDEPSNFNRCCNVIARYEPESREGLLASWKSQVKGIVSSEVAFFPKNQEANLSTEELINLWLNAVFAHVAVNKADDTRHRFEECIMRFGHAPMEHAFRNAVWQLGLQYINMSDHNAGPFLKIWNLKAKLKPSFQIGATFGIRNREVTIDGHTIIRKSSSKFFNEESFEKMFERISSRRQHSGLKFILENLEIPDADKVKSFVLLDSIEEILERAGVQLILEDIPPNTFPTHRSDLRSFSSVSNPDFSQVSGIAAGENRIVTSKEGAEILNRSLKAFKGELRREAQDVWN